jgi:hypothetical protein
VLALALLTAALVLGGVSHQFFSDVATGITVTVFFGGLGVLVARRQPHNPVGWLLIGFDLLLSLSVIAGSYAALCYRLGHPGLPLAPVALLLVTAWVPAFALLLLVILLFPDGGLAWQRWRWVLWAYAGLTSCLWIGSAAAPVAAIASGDIHVNSGGVVTGVHDLPRWLAHPSGWLAGAILIPLAAIVLSFVAHQVLSWRRATGDHRQQLKWLAFGAAVAILLGVVGGSLTSGIVSDVLSFGLFALPVSIGVGILKYRLYDIDRIISRTLEYATVTGLLVGVYAGLVLLATQALPFSLSTPVAVAASTLAAAALFNPLRHRVQQVVDRRFNRARYDADKTVAAFAARLQDALDLDAVRDDLAAVVQRSLEPAHVSVWISQRQPGGSQPAG